MKPIMWSFGMQSRALFHVGENPDLEDAAATAAKAGVKDAVIFGKDHTGLCFHPTKYGIHHPNIKINLTADITSALHRYGIHAIAYFNLGQDGEMCRRNPDWRQESAPGKTLVTKDQLGNVCVFHDFQHTYMFPVLFEMFETCNIDGVFLDTMNAFGYCCCKKCKEAFQKATNRPMPLPGETDNPDWDLYCKWQFKRTVDFMENLRNVLHAKYPKAEILFNHMGGPHFAYGFPGIEDGIISCDPPACYPWISLFSSYLSALKYGGDVFIERFSTGWIDRCDLDDKTMQYKCACIFAHRQRFCVGDRMHPDARLTTGSKHAMQVISNVWKQFNRALPDRLTRTDDFLFIYPESLRYGAEKRRFSYPQANESYREPTLGTFRFLQDCGYTFRTTPEFALKNNLDGVKTVIVSGAEALRMESHSLLKEFVRKGGCVLFCERIPALPDGSLPEYCGIFAAKKSPHTCVYLRGKTQYDKTLVCGNLWDVTLAGAKPLLFGYPQQYAIGMCETPWPYYNASADSEMDLPLLTVNRYGKGKVYFLNCGLMQDYANTVLAAQRKWGKELFCKFLPAPDAHLDGKSGNVELVAYEDKSKDEKVYVLVNHGGRVGSLRVLYIGEHITDPQPPFAVNLMIRTDTDLIIKEGNRILNAARKGKYISIPVVMDSTWKFITVKSKK